MSKIIVPIASLAIVIVLAFTQCEGPHDTPKSPSYLPQR